MLNGVSALYVILSMSQTKILGVVSVMPPSPSGSYLVILKGHFSFRRISRWSYQSTVSDFSYEQ